MFLIEEYLVLIVVAIFVGAVGSAALLVALLLAGEADLLDRVLGQGSVPLPHHWLRSSLITRASERWRKFFLTPVDRISVSRGDAGNPSFSGEEQLGDMAAGSAAVSQMVLRHSFFSRLQDDNTVDGRQN